MAQQQVGLNNTNTNLEPENDKESDVLSLDSKSEFSGFDSDEVVSSKKTKKSGPGKTLKSVVTKAATKTYSKKDTGKQKKKTKTTKVSQKAKDKTSCMVQIDLNNLTDGNVELLKNKLGLSQPEFNTVPQFEEQYYNEGLDYEDEWDESVDINTAPNLHVELQQDSDIDSIGIRNRTPHVKDLSKKLVADLFGSDKENESDSEWKLPKIKKKSKSLPVAKSLSELVNTACTSPCDTEAIVEKYNVPENCDYLVPPLVNGEVWKILDKRAKAYDRIFQDIQNLLAAGMIPMLKLVEMLKSHLSGKEEEKQLISDSITMFRQVQYNLSIRRRYLLRPNICHKYKNLCYVGTPVTNLLFGDDITKEMKNCDTGSTLGNQLGRGRFHQQNMYGPGNSREFNRGRGRYPHNFSRGRGRFMPYAPVHYGQPQFNARGYGTPSPFRGQRRPRPTATVSSAPNGGN